jgi:hypothetical protein
MVAFSIGTTAAPAALRIGHALPLAQEVNYRSPPDPAWDSWPSRVWRAAERLKRVKHRLAATLLVIAALVVATLAGVTTTARPALAAGPGTRWPVIGYGPNPQTDNIILKWDEELLNTIRTGVPAKFHGPTVVARALAILHTATYDAWAAYDDTAVDSRLRLNNPSLRATEVTFDNKEKAISYAAYQVLINLFPSQKAIYDGYMTRSRSDPDPGLGYVNLATETDDNTPATAAGIGNLAADAVLSVRAHDDSNQTRNPDDTVTYPYLCPQAPECYNPDNHNRWNDLNTPWHWQPLCVPLPAPNATSCNAPSAVQPPLTPQWQNVDPFGPLRDDNHYPELFQPPGPPTDWADVDLELRDTTNLSEVQKAKADYWADGPKSEFPPGHWAVFAQALSRMRKGTLDQEAWLDKDAKLFFALGNALMDASISAWAAKYQYDSWRPISAIRTRYFNKTVTSWLGPKKGYGKVLGQNWIPYQEPTVVTPPFPEYVSGHSTFSAVGRLVLNSFFGTDSFNASVRIPAGSTRIEPGFAPSRDVTITWKTLSEAADDAGWSRRWGGIHFYSGDQQGRALGRLIGYNDFLKAQTYWDGSAPQATPVSD